MQRTEQAPGTALIASLPAGTRPLPRRTRRVGIHALVIGGTLCLAQLAVAQTTAPSINVSPSPKAWLQTGKANDAYWVEDNRWGAGSITEGTASTQFEQAIGVANTTGPDGEVAFRMKWRWPNPPGANEVKGYPAVLSGRKPGYYSLSNYVNGNPVRLTDGSILQTSPSGHTPGTIFPMQLPLKSLKAKWNMKHNTAPTGQGQLTFDIWLQSHPGQDRGFTSSSITHEIMIPLANWGGYGGHKTAGGRNPNWYDHDAVIAGKLYHVYATKGSDGSLLYNFGYLNGTYGKKGWKMIAFVPAVLPMDPGEIDVAAIINYISTRKDKFGNPWALGNEYVVSAELGVEPVSGTGDITVFDYKIGNGTTTATAPTTTAPTTTTTTTSPTTSTTGTTSTSCAFAEWNSTKRYMAGEKVTRLGKAYVATAQSDTTWNVNSAPEWTPSLWALTTCSTTSTSTSTAPTTTTTTTAPTTSTTTTTSPTTTTTAPTTTTTAPTTTTTTTAPAPTTTSTGTTSPAPTAPAPVCSTAASWSKTKSYVAGNVVSYSGKQYVAKVSNRGQVPTAGTTFWTLNNCTTASASTTTTTYPTWVQGQSYAAGAIVNYGGKLYIAKHANPGYNPTISTYYWAPYAG